MELQQQDKSAVTADLEQIVMKLETIRASSSAFACEDAGTDANKRRKTKQEASRKQRLSRNGKVSDSPFGLVTLRTELEKERESNLLFLSSTSIEMESPSSLRSGRIRYRSPSDTQLSRKLPDFFRATVVKENTKRVQKQVNEALRVSTPRSSRSSDAVQVVPEEDALDGPVPSSPVTRQLLKRKRNIAN